MGRGVWITVTLGLVSIIACIIVSEYLGIMDTIAILLLMSGFILLAILAPHIFSVRRIGLVSVLVHSQLIFLVLPSLRLVGSIRSEFANRATVAAVLSLFLVNAGAFVASLGMARKLPGKSATWDWARRKGLSTDSRITPWIYTVILGVCIATVVYYVAVAPFIPLITMVRNFGSSIDLLGMREASLKLLSIPSVARYVIEWTRGVFWPLLTSIAVARWAATREWKWFLASLFLILVGLVVVGATTEKAPVACFLLTVVLAYAFMQGKSLRLTIIIPGIAAALLFPFAVYLFNALSAGSDAPFAQALVNLWSRLVLVPARVAMIHYEVFPRYMDFLYGASINGVAQLQGKELFPLSNFLYVNFNPWGTPDNPSGYANAAFTSEMWANFGWPGVVATSFLLGWFLQIVNAWIWTFEKTPTIVAIYSVMVMSVFALISTNVTIFLITKGFLILCLITWLTGRRSINRKLAHTTTIFTPDRSGYRYVARNNMIS